MEETEISRNDEMYIEEDTKINQEEVLSCDNDSPDQEKSPENLENRIASLNGSTGHEPPQDTTTPHKPLEPPAPQQQQQEEKNELDDENKGTTQQNLIFDPFLLTNEYAEQQLEPLTNRVYSDPVILVGQVAKEVQLHRDKGLVTFDGPSPPDSNPESEIADQTTPRHSQLTKRPPLLTNKTEDHSTPRRAELLPIKPSAYSTKDQRGILQPLHLSSKAETDAVQNPNIWQVTIEAFNPHRYKQL